MTASDRLGRLDLTLDAAALTAALVDVPSVSGDERALADLVEAALRELPHLEVVRDGDAIVARTSLGRARRVLLAGHLDTVPIADNVPSRLDGDRLYGCGTTDMKGGVAVMLRVAATVPEPADDLTFVFYDCEEVEATRNGLGRLARSSRDLLDADLAVLMEPSDGRVEAGCQGTVRVVLTLAGRRAHSARAWLGDNAVHAAAPVLATLAAYEPRIVDVDGLEYRESLSAVRISGGVAGNVVPDECVVTINYRFAPDRGVQQALDHVRGLFPGVSMEVDDQSPAAPPGLARPVVASFVDALGVSVRPKYGWTDVARFTELGIPAVNYGPGDPNLAHTREEHVSVEALRGCEQRLAQVLAAGF